MKEEFEKAMDWYLVQSDAKQLWLIPAVLVALPLIIFIVIPLLVLCAIFEATVNGVGHIGEFVVEETITKKYSQGERSEPDE